MPKDSETGQAEDQYQTGVLEIFEGKSLNPDIRMSCYNISNAKYHWPSMNEASITFIYSV